MKTSKLIGPALDWAVDQIEGGYANYVHIRNSSKQAVLPYKPWAQYSQFAPSTDWAQGGPIIEREKLTVQPYDHYWHADFNWKTGETNGPTLLIAAMRCYVASKLGNEVDIPEELQ